MSEYIVSARKYRPQTFDTVVGQQHITTTLKNAIRSQHLAHAYLFCGPRGVGKTTCARILAKTINCTNPTADTEACGVCEVCTSFKNNTSFNVFELDAASNNSVDDIRELTNQVRFAPQHGKYKVYIIDEVHMLSAAAFNAFLKTLEEPPPYAIFILATTEKHKILPTILSRCQIFDFKRITTHDIVDHLQNIASKEGMTAQEAALHVIAQKSEGCMRDALSMLDRISSFTNGILTYNGTMEHLNLLDADFYFGFTDHLLSQDVAGTLLMLDNAMEKGFEGDVVIGGLSEHFRNLLLCKDSRMAKLLDVPNEHKQVYMEKANQAPPSFILSALNVLNQCELEYKNAGNKRLHVEMCLIRLCYLQQAVKGNSIGSSDSGETEVKKNFNRVDEPPLIIKEDATLDQQVAQKAVIDSPTRVTIQDKPIPAQDTTVVAPPPTSNSRRLSKNLLNDLEDAQAAEANRVEVLLTQEIVSNIVEEFIQQLRAEQKNIPVTHFIQIRPEFHPPDELKLVCPTEMVSFSARNNRSLLQELFKLRINKMVRVTVEIQEDETLHVAQTKVLSKSEMFEYMIAKNPLLLKLKEVAGLQLEY